MKGLALMFVACSTVALAQSPDTAKAELKDAAGKSVGVANLVETPHGVLMHVKLTGVPAGTHAFHVHATGKCEAPSAAAQFTSAGGHFNPDAKQHGMLNAMGMHAGDMVDIEVPADGNLTFDVLNAAVTLKSGANSLFKDGGTALMIHGGVDDYKSDPAGNAGPRIACGVVTH
jgi:Cu-Zn family superoxide dismutase